MCAFLFRTHRWVTITMSHGGVTLEPSTALTKVTMAKGRAPLVWDLPPAPSPLPPGDLKGYSRAPNVAASKRRDIHNKDYDHDDIESRFFKEKMQSAALEASKAAKAVGNASHKVARGVGGIVAGGMGRALVDHAVLGPMENRAMTAQQFGVEDSEDSEDSDDEEASPEPRSGMKLEYYRHMPIDAIVRRHEEPPTSMRPTAREMYEEFKHLAVFNVSDMVKLKKAGMTGIAFDLYH